MSDPIFTKHPPTPTPRERMSHNRRDITLHDEQLSLSVNAFNAMYTPLAFHIVCNQLLSLVMFGLPRWFSGKEPTCQRRTHTGDVGSIPGSGRSPEEEMATHSSILAWQIPWTEEPAGLQSMGHKELDMTENESNERCYLCGTIWLWPNFLNFKKKYGFML